MGNHRWLKKAVSLMAVFMLTLSIIPVAGVPDVAYAASSHGLNNPTLKTMHGEQYVSWDSIYFGTYEGYYDDGPQPIKWRVLSVDGDEALLLSDKCLTRHSFDNSESNVTWETSGIRSWLNGSFLNELFTAKEQNAILDTYGHCDDASEGDKLFFLSREELRNEEYGLADAALSPNANDYWTRDTVPYEAYAYAIVEGELEAAYAPGSFEQAYALETHYVRPALRINLSSTAWTNAGTIGTNKCGYDAYWDFDEETGTLTITGKGAIWDVEYDYESVPWDNWKEDVKKLVITKGITECASFADCINLKTVTLPDGLDWIGEYAFEGCSSLTKITIPESTGIGDCAFRDCSSLTEISLPENETSIGYHVFEGCSSLKHIVIPDTVTEILHYAFEGCTSLESVSLPSALRRIGENAFEGCTHLSNVYISKKVTTIGDDAFLDCSENFTIDTPSSSYANDYARYHDIPVMHQFGEWVVKTEATNDQEGLKERTCSVCGETEKQVIPKQSSSGDTGDLEARLATAEKKLADAESRLAEAEKRLDELEAGAAATETEQAELEARVAELEKTKTALEVEKNELASKLAEAEARANAAEEQLTAARVVDITHYATTLSPAKFTYNGQAKEPEVTVSGLTPSDFKVAYTDNIGIGHATVTITGTGNYKGSITKTFTITPAKAVISKVTPGKGKLTVKIKTQKGGVKYQVSVQEKGKKAVTYTVGAKGVKTVKKLQSGKTCTVKARAFKKVGDIVYYGAWSKAKKAKVK